jgi:hypothetical protein
MANHSENVSQNVPTPISTISLLLTGLLYNFFACDHRVAVLG